MSWRYSRRRERNRNEDEDEDEERFSDFFGLDFRHSFKEMDELIDSVFKAAASQGKEISSVGPIYYGYSVTVGPDGKPHVREFGNVKPTGRGKLELGSREPFVDTVVDDKEGVLKIITEMPGVRKEDVQIEVLEDSVKIRAQNGIRNYDTTVPISAAIDPASAHASYNNGVLEIKIKMKTPPRPKGVSIKVD